MKSLFAHRLLLGLCAVLLSTTPALIAEIENEPFPEVERIYLDPPAEETEEQLSWAEDLSRKMDYTHKIHPNAYYHINGTSDDGKIVRMHDASRWEVSPSHRRVVLGWVKDDNIFIKRCVSCFSPYRYVLHNYSVNQIAEVNLAAPPLPMGAATFRITHIEPYKRWVRLSDNTVWEIDHLRGQSFSYWEVGQRVFVGVNNRWRTDKYVHTLINLDMNREPFVPANFYGRAVGYY